MTLHEQIIEAYPELAQKPEEFIDGCIRLQNDGEGDYIAKWEYSKPIPDGLKIGK